jgi:hypothetical protein
LPFDPQDPPFTKRYFLSANQSNTGAAAQALVNGTATPVASPSAQPAVNFQGALLAGQNNNVAPTDPPPAAVADATVTAPTQATTVSPAAPFSNFDLLRILASDATFTSPMSNGHTTNAAFRLSALTVTGET